LTALRYELIAPTTAESWQPEKHEILEQHRSEQPRGTVLKVRRPGYQYQAQIIRKAQIIISAGN
jgi:molecular chaperone GrpE (heat shock protein)